MPLFLEIFNYCDRHSHIGITVCQPDFQAVSKRPQASCDSNKICFLVSYTTRLFPLIFSLIKYAFKHSSIKINTHIKPRVIFFLLLFIPEIYGLVSTPGAMLAYKFNLLHNLCFMYYHIIAIFGYSQVF